MSVQKNPMRWCGICWVVLFSMGVLAAGLMAAPPVTPAEKLAGSLPENTLAFIATSGGNACRPAWEQSHLGKLCADPGVRVFADGIVRALKAVFMEKGGVENPQDAIAKVERVLKQVETIGGYPMAVAVGAEEGDAEFPFYFYWLVDGGDSPGPLKGALDDLFALIGQESGVLQGFSPLPTDTGDLMTWAPKPGEMPYQITYGWIGNRFLLALETQPKQVYNGLTATGARFDTGRLNPYRSAGDLALVYAGTAGLMDRLGAFVKKEAEPRDYEKYLAVLGVLGLEQTGDLVARCGFDGANLTSDSGMQMAMTGKGITGIFKPVDMSLLDQVDENVMDVSLCSPDLNHVYAMIDEVVRTVAPPQDYARFQEELTKLEAGCGIKIREELLGALAGPMVMYQYNIGALPEAYNGGFTAIATLKNPAALEKSLVTLGAFIQQQLAQANPNMVLFVPSDLEIENRTYHNWTIPPLAMLQLMPCWTVVGDKLIVSSNSALCRVAAGRLDGTRPIEKRLADAPAFRQATAGLPGNLISLRYTDTPKMVRHSMTGLQTVWPLATMGLSQSGVVLPAALPMIDHLLGGLEPSVSYTRIDKQGFYSHAKGPLPSGDSVVAVGAAALGVSILMPALSSARVAAQNVACASRLKEIGLGCMLYAQDHEGRFPPDFKPLDEYGLELSVMKCPEAKDAGGLNSYVYRGNDLTEQANSQAILVYDRRDNHASHSRNVLFLDGHVQKMTEAQFQEAVTKDNAWRKEKGLAEKPLDEE